MWLRVLGLNVLEFGLLNGPAPQPHLLVASGSNCIERYPPFLTEKA